MGTPDHRGAPATHPGTGEQARLVVVGGSRLAQALLALVAREWHADARAADSRDRLHLTLVAQDAAALCEELVRRHPALPRHTDLEPVATGPEGQAAELVSVLSAPGRPVGAVVLTGDADEAVLASARIAADRLDGTGIPVVAAVGDEWAHGCATREHVVVVHPWGDDADPAALLDGLLAEAGGRAIHDAYRAADGSAARAWDDLPEWARASSRAQYAAIPAHLAAVWLRPAPLRDWDAPVPVPSVDGIEVLARLEHGRWCRERRDSGWRPGAERDDAERVHPSLVPWASLPEEQREVDRTFARAWPGLLARAGMGLEYVPARAAIARAVADLRATDGERIDPATASRRSLAFVDGIPAKLLTLDLAVAPAGAGVPLRELTPAEVEALAAEEHARWARERRDEGWEAGPRSDADLRHPDLVDWADLPERRREIDRELVRAVPRLLGGAGVRVVPAGERA
ncbi:MAG: RyR domain-containing protein [Thermoleophilia bacterium]